MILTEDILFVMPKDREMQFCAMSALQMYVNNYRVKMEANCVLEKMPEFRFRYWADMSDEDWAFFRRLEIVLDQDREEIGFPDSVIEMSDAKLLSFYNSDKHCAQICGAIAGVETPPFPLVKLVAPAKFSRFLRTFHDGVLWLSVELADSMPSVVFQGLTMEDLLEGDCCRDNSMSIVIGMQSWKTYTAASMGLPVIEILPKNKGVNWLSKFKNVAYRLIEEDKLDRIPEVIANIERLLEHQCRLAQGQAARAGDRTAMVPTALPAVSAVSTSATPR